VEKRGFEEQLNALPAKPGVYLFRDAPGNVLYVGKGANLRNRVRSYFTAFHGLSPKLQKMVARVSDFEFFVTDSDQEALILECNLIKRHRPHYNVLLKDDKTYPYIKVALNEEWPRVFLTRRVEDDGGRYFGPFAGAGSVRKTLDLLRKLFRYCSPRSPITGKRPRPCFDYYINRCVGACSGEISKEEYRQLIDQVILFLEGKQEIVLKGLERKMREASARLDFERATVLRDQIQALDRVTESQKIASAARADEDVVALAQNKNHAYVEVFFIRSGKLIERDHFIVQGTQDEQPSQIMTSFLNQFYDVATYIPPSILIQYAPDGLPILERWLESKRGAKVSLRVPQRGEKKKLVDMVAENARQGLGQMMIKWLADPAATAAALEELKRELQLPQTPKRMECYDISDIRGTSAVGSMVVFEDGKPKPAHYRRFKIKTVEGPDDYAMIQEVLRRRFKQASRDGSTWAIIPDLVLIDGGRGHLNAALDAMKEVRAESIPVASIAKEREELFRPNIADPVILPRTSPALYLVQRLRDEAHRFALGYYQRVKRAESMASALDSVPGIGPKRKQALLKKFGSVKAIKEAPPQEVAAVMGMTPSLAQKVKEYL